MQAVHSLDVGDAYRRALVTDVHGPFNIAAEPVLDATVVAQLLGARTVPLPRAAARRAFAIAYNLRLHPSPPGWFDLGAGVPLLDSGRARRELGWEPRRTAEQALLELLDGLRESAGLETPPLARGGGGPLRVRELATRVGAREH